MLYGTRQFKNGKRHGTLEFKTGKIVKLNSNEVNELEAKIRYWKLFG